MARPSLYSEALASEICGRLMNGQSLREICRDDAMPGLSTVVGWLGAKPEFLARYQGAREVQAEVIAAELLAIADDASLDYTVRDKPNGGVEKVLDHEHVQRARLRIDTRKWLLARMSPKRYGDKLQAEVAANIQGEITVNTDAGIAESRRLLDQLASRLAGRGEPAAGLAGDGAPEADPA